MKSIIFLLLPLIIFIIAFYLTAGVLSREIEISDISLKVFNVINEAEIYKQTIREYVINRLKEDRTIKELRFSGYFSTFTINIQNYDEIKNEIEYEVICVPKEKISGIDLVIHYIDVVNVKL